MISYQIKCIVIQPRFPYCHANDNVNQPGTRTYTQLLYIHVVEEEEVHWIK